MIGVLIFARIFGIMQSEGLCSVLCLREEGAKRERIKKALSQPFIVT